jgi:hypothetical protein
VFEQGWDSIQQALGWFALNGWGYQFWSGIGSGSPIFVLLIVGLKKHNCHVHGCYRLGHVDPEHGFPACQRHHSFGHLHGKAPSTSEADR